MGFSKAAPADGGAILNECSNFDVTNYSSPNFLAFNCWATLMNGGCPCTPEIVDFSSPVVFVSVLVGAGHDNTGTIEMQAFDRISTACCRDATTHTALWRLPAGDRSRRSSTRSVC